MKAPLMAAALVVAFTGNAVSEVRYDRKLEAAVLNIVASRIGDLRGSLAFDVRLVHPEVVDAMTTSSVGSPSMVVERYASSDSEAADGGSVTRILPR